MGPRTISAYSQSIANSMIIAEFLSRKAGLCTDRDNGLGYLHLKDLNLPRRREPQAAGSYRVRRSFLPLRGATLDAAPVRKGLAVPVR